MIDGEVVAKMIIRSATVADAPVIKQIHTRAVLMLCCADYTLEQLETWISQSTLQKQQRRLKQHRVFIAELVGKAVGFVRWNPATNELCSIFVDPDYVRLGVATKLMAHAAEDAVAHGVTAFWLDASLTAVPFYKATGWTFVKPMMHGTLACVRMTKQLQLQEKVD